MLLLDFTDVCRHVHFLQGIVDKALIGHVIKTIPVETDDHCEIACFRDLMCLSYNIGPKQAVNINVSSANRITSETLLI